MTSLVQNTFARTAPVGGLLSRSLAALQTWNDARLTRKALWNLSARELDDIGLTSGDIDRVARLPYNR